MLSIGFKLQVQSMNSLGIKLVSLCTSFCLHPPTIYRVTNAIFVISYVLESPLKRQVERVIILRKVINDEGLSYWNSDVAVCLAVKFSE